MKEKINYQKIFPDKRNEGKTLLEKIHIVELRLLKIFDYICERNNLNYFLIGGTLLGAVRHKGFIPWDDDIDVIMPREDYEKFVKIVRGELPSDLFWQDINTDNFPHFRMLFGKIRDRKSRMEKNKDYNTGVYLDIFVLEKVSDKPKLAKKQKKYLNFLCHLDLLKNNKSFMQQIRIKKLASKNKFMEGILKIFSYFMSIFLKIDFPFFLRKRYYKKINKGNYIYYWYMGGGNYLRQGGDYLELNKKDIFPIKKIQFEDTKVSVLNDSHKFLIKFFGKDYMTPPPKHLRRPEHIDVKETII